MDKFHIQSPKDFIQPATLLIESNIKQLFLHGELWAWKTTFIQVRYALLTWSTHILTSPTYTYFNMYDNNLLHADMRRIEKQTDLLELWFFELLDHYEYLAVERPKRTEEYATPGLYAHITIEKINKDERSLTIIVWENIKKIS